MQEKFDKMYISLAALAFGTFSESLAAFGTVVESHCGVLESGKKLSEEGFSK
jgi:hypothetical protein